MSSISQHEEELEAQLLIAEKLLREAKELLKEASRELKELKEAHHGC